MFLFNHSDKPFNVSHGDRIAKLICKMINNPELEELNEIDDIERG